jgi:Fe-S-cluster containining protein
MADSIDYKEVCGKKCGAKCCKAPSRMRISPEEAGLLGRLLGPEKAKNTPARYNKELGMYEIYFEDTGGACPFLNRFTNLCTIYEVRPLACRKYPTVWEPTCIISGPGVKLNG